MFKYKAKFRFLLVLLACLILASACAKAPVSGSSGVWYEIFVGSFCDSDGDGIGDLQGIISQLDYLSDLGISGIWLTPINPSPSYHKYDVMDYYDIDSDFGTMSDFEQLITECGQRDISIIMDLVINHSSSQHPWFLSAATELKTGSEPVYQNYYNFSAEKANNDWYEIADGWYYEGLFWSEMPDLNMDSLELRTEFENISRFWLEKGVAGFRLDAVKHIYDGEREKNIEFLTWFGDICREVKDDAFLVGEVWSGEGEILAYYESSLDAYFAFPFAGSDGDIHSCVKTRNGDYLSGSLARFSKRVKERNPDGVNAFFLSNHDSPRVASYTGDLNRMKLEAAIYLLLPGAPFMYYGEEIAMKGVNPPDEDVRQPMLWAIVEAEIENTDSLLNYYRSAIELRKLYPDLQDGELKKINTDDDFICALGIGEMAVIHNLSEDEVRLDIAVLCPGMEMVASLSPEGTVNLSDGLLMMPPYSTVLLEMQK